MVQSQAAKPEGPNPVLLSFVTQHSLGRSTAAVCTSKLAIRIATPRPDCAIICQCAAAQFDSTMSKQGFRGLQKPLHDKVCRLGRQNLEPQCLFVPASYCESFVLHEPAHLPPWLCCMRLPVGVVCFVIPNAQRFPRHCRDETYL